MSVYQVGQVYHQFKLERQEEISEINSHVFLFRHERLGVPVLAIKNADENKTFTVAFRTVPEDSTGVAHILEHSVLMGSKKYPVRDVFGEVNKGGLMTFLNAMTGSDVTWYPFATRNLQEYFNLMDVYCDVVFNPLLAAETFEQEGWRYHLEKEADTLQFQGVVLNEMKGAYSDPIRSLFHHTYAGLLPGSTYAHESGGDPLKIPNLNHDQFVDFHQRHYHPSNSVLFFYGNADLDQELAYVSDQFLEKFPTPAKKATLKLGEGTQSPRMIHDQYGVAAGSELSGKTFISVGTVVGHFSDRLRNAALQVIANILYNSDASPLKNKVLESGLGKDFGGIFLCGHSCQTIMMTYLVGADSEQVKPFQTLYRQVLTEMIEGGLDQELVISELNKYEFGMREELTKAQRGLELIGKALPAFLYDDDPYQPLHNQTLFVEIREKALSEGYFEALIQAHLLDNPATVTVVLSPSPDKALATAQAEAERLADYRTSLSPEATSQLIERTHELAALQHQGNTPEQLMQLPRLRKVDLPASLPFTEVAGQSLATRPFLYSEQETGGIVHLDMGFNCDNLDLTLLSYLDLFSTIITEIGTETLGYAAFATALNRDTGGLSTSFNATRRLNQPDFLAPTLWFHLKALSSCLPQALALLEQVLTEPDFKNRAKIKEIVLREYAWSEHSLQSEGYHLAATRAFVHLSRGGQYNEAVTGLSAYEALKRLATGYEAQETDFLQVLSAIFKRMVGRDRVTVGVTAGASDLPAVQDLADSLLAALPVTTPAAVQPMFDRFSMHQGIKTAAEVVYNIQACTLFNGTGRAYDGSFEVLKLWLSREYLWSTIRQAGGAYGCFVQFSSISGNIGLVSYRDPQVAKTYQTYSEIGQTLETLELPATTLEQLVIGAYGQLDPHQGPAAKGSTLRGEYLIGLTPALKQQRLEEILATDQADLRAYADLFQQASSKVHRVTVGNGSKIMADAALFDTIIEP